MPEQDIIINPDVSQDELITKLSEAMGVEILADGGDQAYYSPSQDKIHLPTPESFISELYGIYGPDDEIVSVALSQLGNVGGEPYWSWYGFNSRVEWCACFVSWCADQCGYIEAGICPKYAGCSNGVQWFKERGQWLNNTAEPAPGMVIFFDWDIKGDSGPQDGSPDHTGIVERVENGMIYTIEGNSGDACRERTYPLGYYEILGYGSLKY